MRPPGETVARPLSVLFPTVKPSLPGTSLRGTRHVCVRDTCARMCGCLVHGNGCPKVAKVTVEGTWGREGEAAMCWVALQQVP